MHSWSIIDIYTWQCMGNISNTCTCQCSSNISKMTISVCNTQHWRWSTIHTHTYDNVRGASQAHVHDNAPVTSRTWPHVTTNHKLQWFSCCFDLTPCPIFVYISHLLLKHWGRIPQILPISCQHDVHLKVNWGFFWSHTFCTLMGIYLQEFGKLELSLFVLHLTDGSMAISGRINGTRNCPSINNILMLHPILENGFKCISV